VVALVLRNLDDVLGAKEGDETVIDGVLQIVWIAACKKEDTHAAIVRRRSIRQVTSRS